MSTSAYQWAKPHALFGLKVIAAQPVQPIARPILQPGIGGSFNPVIFFASGEQGGWYDPSDFSTMFQDAAGTTPVTAVGQPVGRILDKSGRGNHATQTTTTSRPVLQQDGNGKYYLSFDGVDDWLVTPSIDFTATDKMTVFAGLRKLSDVNGGIFAELSSSVAANSGAFYLAAPESPTIRYSTVSRGSALSSATLRADTGTTGTSPDHAVLCATHDIAGDLSTIRRNTFAGISGTGDKGTGNFGNYPLFIGRRGGTTLPFNGRIYSLIVRGAQSTAQQIASAEAWVNQRTGAYA